MLGKIVGVALLSFGISFIVGTTIGIFKEIRERRMAAALEENKNEEKEVDKSNEP